MVLIMRIVILVAGLFMALNGFGFLFDPAVSGERFGLSAIDSSGLAAMRADMSAFFLVAGGAIVWGAWRQHGDIMLIPAALFAIALTGRIISVVADGTVDGFWLPMLVEAGLTILLLFASRILPHRALSPK